MSKKRNPTWERSSQVERMMKDNKPVKIREHAPYNKWEQCVKDYLEQDKERWKRKKRGDQT